MARRAPLGVRHPGFWLTCRQRSAISIQPGLRSQRRLGRPKLKADRSGLKANLGANHMTELPSDRIRRATAADAAVVAWHRAAMFRDMGQVAGEDLQALLASSRDAMRQALECGDYLGWLIERAGRVVAGGGVVLRPLLPRPGYLRGGTDAYVLNVYTEPSERRRGLARQVMHAILAWCDAQAIERVTLHASDEGRPLYLALGFAPTNELRRGA